MVKSILDSIVQNFRCQECESTVEEKNLEITSAAGTTLSLTVHCPQCGKPTLVKAEVNSIDLGSIASDGSNLWEIKEKLTQKLSQIRQHIQIPSWPSIQEKEIVDVRKKLKNNNISASDLFEM